MTTRDQAALIARAKALATPVASCVAASLRPDRLLSGCTWEELAALVIVLAESADHVKLRAVVSATEDGEEITELDVILRKAHRRAQDLRALGLKLADMPADVQRLERAYLQRRKVARRVEAQAAKEGQAA